MMKNILMVAALCSLLGPAPVSAQSGSEADQKAIRDVMDQFMAAWNRHDARAWTAVFAEDSDFTNVRGVSASGRPNIEEFHAQVFATMFKNSVQKYTDIKIRFIRPDVAAVDVHWEMTGATDSHGNPWPERKGLLNFVMTKDTGKWEIKVMHNLDLSPPPAK
jgi:uncharacterized protein (TIGR02246 family)